jgi:glutamate dehydrogenase
MYQIQSESHRRTLRTIAAAGAKLRRRMRHIDLAEYLEAYYGNVDGADLAACNPKELAAAAIAHLDFSQRRRRGHASVRVINPTVLEQGYFSPHTIIEMVNDDMPFLVDSIGLALERRGLTVHFLAHPVFAVARDRAGALRDLQPRSRAAGNPALRLESFQHIEVDRIVDAAELSALTGEIARNLDDVRVACADWSQMRGAAQLAAADVNLRGPRFDADDVEETRALLQWMAERHFTFLGYREYRLRGSAPRRSLAPVPASGCGILRDGRPRPPQMRRTLSSDLQRQIRAREIAVVTKSNSEATVHRSGYLDYVGIKQCDAAGRVIGERRFLGLWTSSAYNSTPEEIPLLRHKVRKVVGHFGLAPDSHDGKALQHIISSIPRDELFQASVPELIRTVSGVFGLQERPRVRLIMRRDPFRRFYSCLIFVPREKYNTPVRQRIERVLAAALQTTSLESQVQIAQGTLARIHVVARTEANADKRIDVDGLERQLAAAVRSWSDDFKSGMLASYDEARALQLVAKYSAAFPAAYQEDFDAATAVLDVAFLEALAQNPAILHMELYRPTPRDKDRLFLKIYRDHAAIPISDLLPMLENMGLRVITERPYQLTFAQDRRGWIQDLELQIDANAFANFELLARDIKSLLRAVWTGRADSDSFNRLTLHAGIPWRQVNVIRAYCRYLLQTGLPFSQGYIAQVLTEQAPLARLLADLFATRFDPKPAARSRPKSLARINERIGAALELVVRSDEDRILRSLWNVIGASVRTNAYQSDAAGLPKTYLSFKVECQQLRDLPLPRPLFEIFVFSQRMEGLHMRMGSVARGGIRWSDRREDFRTEILGLMKAQHVKNTVIVPVGAKGGFVLKRMPAGDRDAQQAEVIACYQTLIRGMLDLTDNIIEDKTVPPANVVRYDGADPYLVVAADKGTATFSDIANALSADYNFWLGDAFASGGSAGYDHKKMAITARGGWECVKRHFREFGVDIQRSEFSVAGIGDMAGDVFGNGMLQSQKIRLVAAFNHQHIFIDPAPNAARSFRERTRLFALPRSSWDDYARNTISTGGGVFLRSLKAIPLSKEAQALLGLPTQSTPNDVVRAILKLPVDLLWNGGIGTYVKSSTEGHSDVGDRSNDAVRVDGRELRCKVVGEGGNLGFTQLGRIEYAGQGGRLNTDFIDNSAGVNCSDVEVNLKILLNVAMRAGEVTRPARDRLLASMTDEVAEQVLRNNYMQSQAISVLEAQAKGDIDEAAFVLRALERSGDLNRALEFLPSEEEIADRRRSGAGLTRPELAIALSYGKIWLYRALIHSSVPENAYFAGELARQFPPPIQKRFPLRLKRHRLRREIIATAITNSLINRMGPAFPIRAQADTGADPAAVARAYTMARDVFAVRSVWEHIDKLDNRIAATVQYAAIERTTRLLRHASYWLLKNHSRTADMETAVRYFAAPVAELTQAIGAALGPAEHARQGAQRAELVAQGLPEPLAHWISSCDPLHSALDLVEISKASRLPIAFAATAYFDIGERIGLDWLKQQIEALQGGGHWHAVAHAALLDNLYELQRRITGAALRCQGRTAAARVNAWLAARPAAISSLNGLLTDLRSGPPPDFATLSVALESVRHLPGATT